MARATFTSKNALARSCDLAHAIHYGLVTGACYPGAMGEGEPRRSKRTARYDTRELAVLSKKQTPTEADWDEKIAAGSQKLPVAIAISPRTTTVDDPLTTRILAEVARRTTIEVSPDQIDQIDEAAGPPAEGTADVGIDDLGDAPADDPT